MQNHHQNQKVNQESLDRELDELLEWFCNLPKAERIKLHGIKVGPNEPCLCESGKKNKKCCRVV